MKQLHTTVCKRYICTRNKLVLRYDVSANQQASTSAAHSGCAAQRPSLSSQQWRMHLNDRPQGPRGHPSGSLRPAQPERSQRKGSGSPRGRRPLPALHLLCKVLSSMWQRLAQYTTMRWWWQCPRLRPMCLLRAARWRKAKRNHSLHCLCSISLHGSMLTL